MICCVINHWLVVSYKADQITSWDPMQRFIYLQLTNKMWFITQQIMHKSWSISKWPKSNCILQILLISYKEIPPRVLTVTLIFTCISNAVDLRKTSYKTDISKASKWCRNCARQCCLLPPSDLFQNKSLLFSVASIGALC